MPCSVHRSLTHSLAHTFTQSQSSQAHSERLSKCVCSVAPSFTLVHYMACSFARGCWRSPHPTCPYDPTPPWAGRNWYCTRPRADWHSLKTKPVQTGVGGCQLKAIARWCRRLDKLCGCWRYVLCWGAFPPSHSPSGFALHSRGNRRLPPLFPPDPPSTPANLIPKIYVVAVFS